MSMFKMAKYSLFIIALFVPSVAFAHPSPIDFGGIHRHDIGVAASILGIAISLYLYVSFGLKKGNRSETLADYFFYSKETSINKYFDTTVGYSFQVVITIYFMFWGFKYGIGIAAYALTWCLGFFVFKKCANRLIEFAYSNNTLHGFLSEKYNSSVIRKITAVCTLFGIVGGLLVEVNYTTDTIAQLSLNQPISTGKWSFIFLSLILSTWYYVRYGGFKSTVNTATIQLPVVYLTLNIVLTYLVWLAFYAENNKAGLYIGIIISLLWVAIFIGRSKAQSKTAKHDIAAIVCFFNFIFTAISTLALVLTYGQESTANKIITDIPESFSLAGFFSQDKYVFIGFFILNVSWQFFDMSSWQRIGSLDLSSLPTKAEKAHKIESAIGETMLESPITWMFGIVFGIGLRYSGLFSSGNDAFGAFNIFTQNLSDNDLHQFIGMVGSYAVLPSLMIAFVGIMLSTTDNFLNIITYVWFSDLSRHDVSKILNQKVKHSDAIRKANRFALIVALITSIVFIVITKLLGFDVFVFINTAYSAQFVISIFTLGALFLVNPPAYSKIAIVAVSSSLIANVATATYCGLKMKAMPDSIWSDWFYVLPTIVSAIVGYTFFLAGIFLKLKVKHSGV